MQTQPTTRAPCLRHDAAVQVRVRALERGLVPVQGLGGWALVASVLAVSVLAVSVLAALALAQRGTANLQQ